MKAPRSPTQRIDGSTGGEECQPIMPSLRLHPMAGKVAQDNDSTWNTGRRGSRQAGVAVDANRAMGIGGWPFGRATITRSSSLHSRREPQEVVGVRSTPAKGSSRQHLGFCGEASGDDRALPSLERVGRRVQPRLPNRPVDGFQPALLFLARQQRGAAVDPRYCSPGNS